MKGMCVDAQCKLLFSRGSFIVLTSGLQLSAVQFVVYGFLLIAFSCKNDKVGDKPREYAELRQSSLDVFAPLITFQRPRMIEGFKQALFYQLRRVKGNQGVRFVVARISPVKQN